MLGSGREISVAKVRLRYNGVGLVAELWIAAMHVLFIHPNFPSQFFPMASYLARLPGWQATLLTSVETSHLKLPFNHAAYHLKPGPLPKVFYNPETLAGLMEHLPAVYYGLKRVPQIKPDLVVGHVSYGTWLYLRNLYDCPFVGYFEILPPRVDQVQQGPVVAEEALLARADVLDLTTHLRHTPILFPHTDDERHRR